MKSSRVEALPLWVDGSYDGPASGFARFNSALHWYNMLGSPYHFMGCRAYALYPLTRWERAREVLAHWTMALMAGNYETQRPDGRKMGRRWRLCRWHPWWVFTLRVKDMITGRGRFGSRKKYDDRRSPGYFIFAKDVTPPPPTKETT